MDSKIDNEEGIFRKVKCGVCRKRVAARLCDFVIDYRQLAFFRDYHDFSEQQLHGTCDMPLCDECAKRYNNIYDFCPFHYDFIKKIQPTPEMKRAITEYVTKDLLNF